MSLQTNLTPWFPGGVKPARRGVYQRTFGGDAPKNLKYSLWDGRKWLYSRQNIDTAANEENRSAWQCLEWRGLAEEPKK